MDPSFMKADSGNLPSVDLSMILDYLSKNSMYISAQTKNIKTLRNAREGYGDEAVGKVQVKRDLGTPFCSIKAKITPEHRIHVKAYNVEAVVNEEEEEIVDCKCCDCVASQGGCKHGVALLFWLHRRSEEPSVTSTTCYWQASKLGRVGADAAVPLQTLYETKVPNLPAKNEEFRRHYLSKAKQCSSKSLLYQLYDVNVIQSISLHCLGAIYKAQLRGSEPNVDDFKLVCIQRISAAVCKDVEEITRSQYKCSKWYDARYGRITASKAHEVSRCKTDGTLVQSIFGATKIKTTEAMKRGILLEEQVLQVVKQKMKINIKKCGLIINSSFPFFGASPDGITDTYCVEIKCPFKKKTIHNYLTEDGLIAIKPLTQLQLQMYLCNREKGLFCVADPEFELNKNVKIIEVERDDDFCVEIINKCSSFFSEFIFKQLLY